MSRRSLGQSKNRPCSWRECEHGALKIALGSFATLAAIRRLMRERIERIELNGRIEQLRAQNKRLDEENEHLAEMVRFAPQLDAAMSAQKLDQA